MALSNLIWWPWAGRARASAVEERRRRGGRLIYSSAWSPSPGLVSGSASLYATGRLRASGDVTPSEWDELVLLIAAGAVR